MEVKEEHSENAFSPIIVTLFGIVIEVKEEQEKNAPHPIVVIPSEIITFLISSYNAPHGLAEGYSKFIISPSPVKVISPVSLSSFQFIVPIAPDINEEQEENALFSIIVTLFAMEMEVKEEHL